MAKKRDFKNMSTKKKSRVLFWGMLAPLLMVTFAACTFFYYVTNAILQYYLTSELNYSVKKINSDVMERMEPINVNLENFANFAALSDDEAVLQGNAEHIGRVAGIFTCKNLTKAIKADRLRDQMQRLRRQINRQHDACEEHPDHRPKHGGGKQKSQNHAQRRGPFPAL